jgi:hypothetical protein
MPKRKRTTTTKSKSPRGGVPSKKTKTTTSKAKEKKETDPSYNDPTAPWNTCTQLPKLTEAWFEDEKNNSYFHQFVKKYTSWHGTDNATKIKMKAEYKRLWIRWLSAVDHDWDAEPFTVSCDIPRAERKNNTVIGTRTYVIQRIVDRQSICKDGSFSNWQFYFPNPDIRSLFLDRLCDTDRLYQQSILQEISKLFLLSVSHWVPELSTIIASYYLPSIKERTLAQASAAIWYYATPRPNQKEIPELPGVHTYYGNHDVRKWYTTFWNLPVFPEPSANDTNLRFAVTHRKTTDPGVITAPLVREEKSTGPVTIGEFYTMIWKAIAMVPAEKKPKEYILGPIRYSPQHKCWMTHCDDSPVHDWFDGISSMYDFNGNQEETPEDE